MFRNRKDELDMLDDDAAPNQTSLLSGAAEEAAHAPAAAPAAPASAANPHHCRLSSQRFPARRKRADHSPAIFYPDRLKPIPLRTGG